MINEEKVRELFNIALCDSKSDDSRVQKQSASYYGWDYIWKEGLKSFFTGTFAFAGLVVMWVAVNAAELLDRINKLDFKAMGVTIGILYIAFMAVYIFVTIVVYTASKLLVMVRTALINKFIRKLLVSALYKLLKDSLAIIKELLILNISHDKPKHKLLCISKTTI